MRRCKSDSTLLGSVVDVETVTITAQNVLVRKKKGLAVGPSFCVVKNWLLGEVCIDEMKPKLPLASFNHIAREVLCLEKTMKFYCEILGFQQIPRPPFEAVGVWLIGYGLSLHLVQTKYRKERALLQQQRIKHFAKSFPRVDHIAFITQDLDAIRKVLEKQNIYYRHDKVEVAGIEQIFLFDPDGNVIEVSNCAPPVGAVHCQGSNVVSAVVSDDTTAQTMESLEDDCPLTMD